MNGNAADGSWAASFVLFAALAACVSVPSPERTDTPAPLQRPLVVLDQPVGLFDRIICDPDPCLRQLTSPNTGPATETMVLIDYTDPSLVIEVDKDFRMDNTACVAAVAHVSHDGGLTWRETYPRAPDPATGRPSTDRCESDPVVAFDGRGNALIETLELSRVDALFTYRSPDRGATWRPTANAFDGPNDKNWMATDWETGRMYSNTGYTCDGGQAVMFTDDSSDSWSDPVCTDPVGLAQIEVDAAGRVHMVGLLRGDVRYLRSDDGGVTWSSPRTIGRATPGASMPLGRASPFIDIGVSYGTDAVFTAWNSYEASETSVWLAWSVDGGETWKEPLDLGRGMPAANRFLPAVAASPAGDVHVVFYDDRADPTHAGLLLDVMYLHGRLDEDGAARFDHALPLTSTPFATHPANDLWPFFPGHYIGLAATNQRAIATFAATFNSRAEIFAVAVGH